MASTKQYLANTANPNDNTLNALYDVARQAGIKNTDGMNAQQLTTAIKQATGTSGNTYGNTIGNRTLEQYGYKVDKNGNITVNNLNLAGTNYSVPSTYDGKNAYNAGLANYNNYMAGVNTLGGGWDNYINELQNGMNSANASLARARNNALEGINSNYDNSARNYYRLYRTQETELPVQLSSVGATGGASESAALRLMNSYSDNLYKNETSRNQDITSVNADYENAVAQNSAQLGQMIANAYLEKAQAMQALQSDFNQSQMDVYNNYLSGEAAREDARNAAALVAQNNQARQAQYDLERQGYSTKGWTDANGVYQYSITGDPKASKGRTGSGGGGGNDNPKPVIDDVQPTTYTYNDLVKALRNSSSAEDLSAVNTNTMLALYNGTITQQQANLIASSLYAKSSGRTPTKKSAGSVKKGK